MRPALSCSEGVGVGALASSWAVSQILKPQAPRGGPDQAGGGGSRGLSSSIPLLPVLQNSLAVAVLGSRMDGVVARDQLWTLGGLEDL